MKSTGDKMKSRKVALTVPAGISIRDGGKAYSVVHTHTGMQLALISGKRRLAKLLSEVDFMTDSWVEMETRCGKWRNANPRKAAS